MIAAVNLLLVLLGAGTAGLLVESAGLTVTVPVDLLLVLLGTHFMSCLLGRELMDGGTRE